MANQSQVYNLAHTGFLLLFVFMIVLTGCSKGKKSQAGDTGRKMGAVPVEVKVIQPGEILDQIFATGSLLANEKIELRSEVSGRITGIFFEEGTAVEKGRLLVKINDNDLKAQLRKVETQEKLASEEEFRKRKLNELKAISQEEYDISLNQLNAISAEKDLLLAQIDKTEIRAPFSGQVGLRSVSPGSYVSSSALIATLQQLDPIKVEFMVPEKYSREIRRGTMLSFTITGSDRVYDGRVYAVESGIDPLTRTIKVRATCSNPKRELVPGTFARIFIILQRIPDALKVPSEALVPELNGNKVFLCRDGKAVSVPVITGIRTDSVVQITQGLKPGDSLIVSGLMQISDGSPLAVKPSLPAYK